MKLLLIQYNNYFNRIEKTNDYETFADWKANINKYAEVPNYNFVYGDGIEATCIFNWEFNWIPDYCLVGEDSSLTPSYHYFILEFKQIRKGQYQAKLLRDSIIDNLDFIKSNKLFVESATLTPTDIAIHNFEDYKFNEIKKSETTLRDLGRVPYIVGYYTSDQDVSINVPLLNVSVATFETLESSPLFEYHINPYKVLTSESIEMWYNMVVPGALSYKPFFKHKTNTHEYELLQGAGQEEGGDYKITLNQQQKNARLINNLLSTYDEEFITKYNTQLGYHTQNEYDTDMKIYENKLIYISTGTTDYPSGYYRVSVNKANTQIHRWETSSQAVEYFNDILDDNGWNVQKRSLVSDYESNYLNATFVDCTFDFAFEQGSQYTFTLPATANKLDRAPYKMFAIPADERWVRNGEDSFETLDRSNAMNIASSIAKTLTQQKIYDLQLLPYCPISDEAVNSITGFYIETLTSGLDYIIINDGGQTPVNKEIILFPKTDNFSFTIYNTNSIDSGTTAIDKKVIKQCDKYRLCSPNYNSFFDFNPVDTGTITEWSVDCTYRPGTPYIHINPIWGELYGQDFDDCRGLICKGDFSIPYASDKWQEYVLQNKNYQNFFDRETESLEKQNALGHTSDIFGAMAGTLQASIMGSKFAGTAGGVGMGIVSGMAGISDIAINSALRREQMSLRQDTFNMNLENIQALPQTLTKVSTYDYNNKVFPILEYYTCSDKEKEVFRDALKYNGMKVNRIDEYNTFITKENGAEDYQFFKANLIRLDNFDDDLHMANQIAYELSKGVYI